MLRAAGRLLVVLGRLAVGTVVFAGVVAFRLWIALGLVLVVVVGAVFLAPVIWAQLPSPTNCAGQMNACYQAWKMPDAMKRTRLAALANFAASEGLIVFQVILDNDEHGLLFIDRMTGKSKLIYEKDKAYVRPHFSSDGKRLVLIQRNIGVARQEIISCSTGTWRCVVLLETGTSVESAIEIEDGTHIYAAGSRTINVKGSDRDVDWDFYLLKKGATPVRLSDLQLSAVRAVSVANDKLIFRGYGEALLGQQALSRPSSGIYAVDLDPQSRSTRKLRTIETIEVPHRPKFLEQIAPIFMINDSLSHSASVSRDGRYAAILNNIKHGKYRWDLLLVASNGTPQRRIELNGLGFSRGEFVGETLLFSELYDDWYYVHALNIPANELDTILHIDHAPAKLRSLDQIRPVVESKL